MFIRLGYYSYIRSSRSWISCLSNSTLQTDKENTQISQYYITVLNKQLQKHFKSWLCQPWSYTQAKQMRTRTHTEFKTSRFTLLFWITSSFTFLFLDVFYWYKGWSRIFLFAQLRNGIINWVDNINWPPLGVSKLTFWVLALCQRKWRNCG